MVDAYLHDPLCGFTFTAQGFYDLFSVLQRVNRRDWAAQVPRRLPILMISGEEDPVGGYGKGVGQGGPAPARKRPRRGADPLTPGGPPRDPQRDQPPAGLRRRLPLCHGLAPGSGAAE